TDRSTLGLVQIAGWLFFSWHPAKSAWLRPFPVAGLILALCQNDHLPTESFPGSPRVGLEGGVAKRQQHPAIGSFS
ncbi:MAG: hypothetical protein NT159_12350, partial [Proteobacteria bacterium]|nr:hypothetical protein [Pseudomonadota bacterium]